MLFHRIRVDLMCSIFKENHSLHQRKSYKSSQTPIHINIQLIFHWVSDTDFRDLLKEYINKSFWYQPMWEPRFLSLCLTSLQWDLPSCCGSHSCVDLLSDCLMRLQPTHSQRVALSSKLTDFSEMENNHTGREGWPSECFLFPWQTR